MFTYQQVLHLPHVPVLSNNIPHRDVRHPDVLLLDLYTLHFLHQRSVRPLQEVVFPLHHHQWHRRHCLVVFIHLQKYITEMSFFYIVLFIFILILSPNNGVLNKVIREGTGFLVFYLWKHREHLFSIHHHAHSRKAPIRLHIATFLWFLCCFSQ